MSLSLYNRVSKALEYLKENPTSKVVVSGGQGKGEAITEAEAMAQFFYENGIERDRIIKEEKSTTTFENIKFSKEFLNGEKEVIIVSNDFHLYRASMIAKRLGLKPYTLSAETPAIVKTQLWIREYIAVLKSLLFDKG
ncbi:YdcF family protein [Bacillus sp. P2(2020)]|uniref:YdcF family protein n=1 Tax=Calidifontibacillus erzurumensis TaxID=2741433 RepID=A0A8J8KDH0_9BACI|nr:YdcF family protein [Calidifontibacillus erzurumensis]